MRKSSLTAKEKLLNCWSQSFQIEVMADRMCHHMSMHCLAQVRNISSSISQNFGLEGPISIIPTLLCR